MALNSSLLQQLTSQPICDFLFVRKHILAITRASLIRAYASTAASTYST